MRAILLLVFLAALQMAHAGSAAAQIWNLADNWSDEVNPNGVWSYNGSVDTPITTLQADWDPSSSTIFGSPQPAWSATPYPQNDHVPMLFKRVSDVASIDVPVGRIGIHGNEWNDPDIWVGVVWTSPIIGMINIAGSVWYAHTGASRNSDWRIRLNEIILTTGNVAFNDGTSSSTPENLLDGSGGALALQSLPVSPGDTITLEFISLTSWAAFVGADLTIIAEPVAVAHHPLPHTRSLHQNHPNPFNPMTTITFSLPSSEMTSLDVFDMSGHIVQVLLRGEMLNQGIHERVWNGCDWRGRGMPSGTYFYRLTAGGYTETRRMVLLK
jgi:hypothetical protein